MAMGKTQSPFGPLYVAWGQHAGAYYGIWGIRGVAQQIEFKAGAAEADVKAHLIECAMIFALDMQTRNAFDTGRHFHA